MVVSYIVIQGDDLAQIPFSTPNQNLQPKSYKSSSNMVKSIIILAIIILGTILTNSLMHSNNFKQQIYQTVSAAESETNKSSIHHNNNEDTLQTRNEIAQKDRVPSISMPIMLPIINSNNVRIQDYLYKDQFIKQQRIKYQKERIKFIDANRKQFKQLHLAKHNLILDDQAQLQADLDNLAEEKRLQQKYNLSSVTQQLPICIISPGYNNAANFRIEYSLNSILAQDYSNYRLILINDASTDNSDQIYQKYFEFLHLNSSRFIYVHNKQQLGAMQNFYIGATKYCSRESIVVTLDADDELIGRKVLKLFNWAYQKYKSGVVYSNFYWYIQSKKVINGFTSNLEYSQEEKQKSLYRKKSKISQLRSFRNQLFLEIDPRDFKDSKGNFYQMTSDFAIFMPLLELSCTRIYKFRDQFHYLYNSNTGINDGVRSRQQQYLIEQQLKRKPKYNCSQRFKNG